MFDIPSQDYCESKFNDTESESVASDSERLLRCKEQNTSFLIPAQQSRRTRCLIITNIIVLSASLVILLFMMALMSRHWSDKNYYLKAVTAYSPVMEDLKVPMTLRKMEGTLLVDPDTNSIFRQEPSKKVDAAWNRLANVRPIPITREDVVRIGKDAEQAAKFPESFGFGPDAYIGRMDVFHVVHCLDQVRREAYFDHYYGALWGTRANGSELHRTHISHCIHLLLQNILCSPNLDVYTHFWADAQANAFPDFSVNHKCVDFKAILRWQEENSVDVDEFAAIRRPDDHIPQVMTPKFKELFGYEGPGRFEGERIG